MRWALHVSLALAVVGGWIAIPSPGALAEATERLPSASPGPVGDTLRTLEPEDLFRLHRVGDVRFSPDGEKVVYELTRPGDEGAVQKLPHLFQERSDLWIASGEEDEPRPLTDGAADGSSWFHPRWSPDGERLAFLSMEGNEVRAWLWERGEAEPRPLTDRPVHLTKMGPLLLKWTSEREVALAVRPEGRPSHGRLLAETTRPGLPAMEAWEASWSGREATAEVLDAGPGAEDEAYVPRSEVVILDVEGGSQTVAEGRWALAVPSPGGDWLATLSEPPVGEMAPETALPQRWTYARRPGAVRLEAGDGSTSREASMAEALDDPRLSTLRWAPDGHAFALLERSSGDETDPAIRVAVYRPSEGRLERVGRPDKQIQDFAWTGEGELLVRARATEEDGGTGPSHWWRPPTEGDDPPATGDDAPTEGDGPPAEGGDEWEAWTDGMDEVPSDLAPVPGGAAGVVDGVLWRLADGHHEPVKDPEAGELHGLVGPVPPFSLAPTPQKRRTPADPLRLLASSPDGMEVWTVQVDGEGTREMARLPVPEGAGPPVDVAPTGDRAAFSAWDETGTWLWTSRPDPNSGERDASAPEPEAKPPEPDAGAGGASPAVDTLVARDQWLEEVEGAETRQLEYRSSDGEELTAWMLLPPDRAAGEAHPTVVWVYPGIVHGGRAPVETRLNYRFAIGTLQLLAARGYAVLLPSVPLESDEAEGRPDFTGSVLPAVDRAVEEGLTDESRLGLMGHSYGGFAVNHLLSQTDRFEAAVTASSMAHLRSFYGMFDARARYGHIEHPLTQQLFTHGYFETGQGGMGAPPALTPERYRDASPLKYVDEVDTPLMLIHGDQDYVPIQQAEMFFNELVRMGNRARLVRYAGEGHVIKGRANVLHMWEGIFDWFEDYLGS